MGAHTAPRNSLTATRIVIASASALIYATVSANSAAAAPYGAEVTPAVGVNIAVPVGDSSHGGIALTPVAPAAAPDSSAAQGSNQTATPIGWGGGGLAPDVSLSGGSSALSSGSSRLGTFAERLGSGSAALGSGSSALASAGRGLGTGSANASDSFGTLLNWLAQALGVGSASSPSSGSSSNAPNTGPLRTVG